MTTSRLLKFGLLVLAVSLAATVLVARQQPTGDIKKPLLFPALSEQLEQVAKIRISGSQQRQITLSRGKQLWGIDNFDGYPALPEKIKNVLIGISELRMLEQKTANERLYHRLGVSDIDAEGARSMRLQLMDAAGKELADLIIGLPRKSRADESKSGLYVRLPDDAQSWLVEGRLELSLEGTYWFERLLFDLHTLNIRSMDIRFPDGENYHVFKDALGQPDFSLEPVPTGMRPAPAIILNRFDSLLRDFHASAVCLPTNCPPDNEPVAVHVQTFEGLTLHMQAYMHQELSYATFRFTLEDNTQPEAELSSLVNFLQQRLHGWAFQIPEHKYDLVKRRAIGLLRKVDSGSSMDDI